MHHSIFKSPSIVKAFSLLEVLIALVVLATALVALSGSLNQTVKSQLYQKNRTLAHYVATYRLGEVKIDQPWPNVGTTRGEISMLNREWLWKQTDEKTSEPSLRKVEIAVSEKRDEDYSLAKLTAFLGKPNEEQERR